MKQLTDDQRNALGFLSHRHSADMTQQRFTLRTLRSLQRAGLAESAGDTWAITPLGLTWLERWRARTARTVAREAPRS